MAYNSISWFDQFFGVGYRYYDVYMNVFLIFKDKRYAFKLWKKTMDWWRDDQIKLRFVEREDEYWFIAYDDSQYERENIGFVKNMLLSDNYQRFKVGYEKKVILRFGIYKENEKKGLFHSYHNDEDDDDDNYSLELLKRSKLVYDIRFCQYSDLPKDSIEWQCIQNNRR